MPKQDLYIGLGGLLYALTKTDGRLHPEEFKTMEETLCKDLNGEIAFYAFQLWEAFDTNLEEAYQFALRRFKENKKDFDAETKKRFVTILQQVAMAYDGVSRKEKDLLKRCRRDIARA